MREVGDEGREGGGEGKEEGVEEEGAGGGGGKWAKERGRKKDENFARAKSASLREGRREKTGWRGGGRGGRGRGLPPVHPLIYHNDYSTVNHILTT